MKEAVDANSKAQKRKYQPGMLTKSAARGTPLYIKKAHEYYDDITAPSITSRAHLRS